MRIKKFLSVILCIAMLSTMSAGLSLSVNASENSVNVITTLEFSGIPTDQLKKYTESFIYWSDTNAEFTFDNGIVGSSWHKCTDVISTVNTETASVTGTIHPSSLNAYYIVVIIFGHTEKEGYQNLIGYYSYNPKSNVQPKAERGAQFSGSSNIVIHGSIEQLADENGRWAYCIRPDGPVSITAASSDPDCGTVSSAGGEYDTGSSVSFTAAPSADSRFTGWYSDGKLVCSDEEINLIATANADYTAMFEKKYSYVVSNGNAIITGCDPSITGDITIPTTLGGHPVTGIGSRAFSNNTSVTSIIVPDCVTSIGSYAFNGCTNLESITLGSGLESIETFAFNSCSKLTNIVIPDSVTTIEASAFKKCSGLTGVTLSNNLTSMETSLFEGCSKLTAITVPNSVRSIKDRAFYGCTKLVSITLPSSLDSFGNMIFYNCSELTSVNLPGDLTNIGQYTFYGCRSLSSITLPLNITTVDKYVFYNCSSLSTIVIPEGVTTIGANAFYRCSALESISLPDSLSTISANAFYYCSKLTDITIPSNVISIASTSFKNSGLTTIRCYPNTYAQTFGTTNGYTVILLEAHTHVYDNWTILKQATCSATGLRRGTCTICGHEETEIIPTLPHTYEVTTVAPTCTEDGGTLHTCSVCGYSYSDDIVPMLGHDLTSEVVDPTCTKGGYTAYSCSRCGYAYQDDITEALGHDYIVTVYEPTCKTAGYTLHECSRCGDQYVDEFTNSVDHDYVPEVVEPTCTDGGYTLYACRFCGDSYTQNPTPALGHNYAAAVTAPTCTAGGFTTHTCSRCGDSYTDTPTPAAGHIWGAWENHPTDTTKEIRYCTKCSASETRDKEAVDSPLEKIGGYKVKVTGLDASKKYNIRYATGEYTSVGAIKIGTNAGFVQVSGVTETVITLPTHGVHTVAVQTGSTVSFMGTVDLTAADIKGEFLVSTDDLNLKVENLYGANYVKIYKDGKAVSSIGSSKFASDGLKYWINTTVPAEGTYLVRIAYLDGTMVQENVTFTVPASTVSANGRIFTIANYGGAGNISYMRLAKGTITTAADMKAAPDLRTLGAKYFKEDTAAFAALDAVNGTTTTYTVQIFYVSGYSEFITFDITPTVPVITTTSDSIILTNVQTNTYCIDWVRCAPGEQTSLYGIRHAKGSQVRTTASIENGAITFTGLEPGTYTLFYLYDGWNLSEGMVTVTVQ